MAPTSVTWQETGVAGLDDILGGGLDPGHIYLVEGSPGTGKTTVALRYLLEGARLGQKGLYIILNETEAELRAGAASHGWDIGPGVEVFELAPAESVLDADLKQSLLYSSDLELGETTQAILKAVEQAQAVRVVIDSLSEIRLLAQSPLRYRRQILALKHFFSRNGATVLMLDDTMGEIVDRSVHSVAHGVLVLEQLAPDYGAERRRMRVVKYRGHAYRGGLHDFTINTGGVEFFPRLVASEHRGDEFRGQVSTGKPGLDALLGGGYQQGSSTLIMGPAGCGKTTLGVQFAAAAIARGGKAAIFLFDEEINLLMTRAHQLGFDLAGMRDRGALTIEQVDAAELSPGEFSNRVRKLVTSHGVDTVVIDSLNGFQAAMPDERLLTLHMHEVLLYLNRQGVSTFLTIAQHGVLGQMESPLEISYLADTVILLRYFELAGRIRRAISVVKKRTGAHDDSIREFCIDTTGIEIGDAVVELHGVLRGNPVYASAAGLLADEDRV